MEDETHADHVILGSKEDLTAFWCRECGYDFTSREEEPRCPRCRSILTYSKEGEL